VEHVFVPLKGNPMISASRASAAIDAESKWPHHEHHSTSASATPIHRNRVAALRYPKGVAEAERSAKICFDIYSLRDWLREEPTWLTGKAIFPGATGANPAAAFNFNDHSNWYNTPGTPSDWKNFSNWTNGS
jgi:hypothetical protein